VNPDYLRGHRAHDVEGLLARWRNVATKAGLRWEELQPGLPLLRSAGAWNEETAVYLSAGIHGDEPAGTEGLITWAESRIEWLRQGSCFIVPCFNPDGLQANTRRTADGFDLNREFHHARHPLIAAWREAVDGLKFRLALCLHEDYDATGTYLYELGEGESSIGGACLDACAEFIPREAREEVEGWAMDRGLLYHGGDLEELLGEMEEGLPEAIYLRVHHAPAVITFETPSEFGLDARVAAQVRCIDAALAACGLALR
jgi:hypothetical protein